MAKVRYRAPAGIDANDVRVFFRMFTTAATGLAYNAAAYPRQGDGTNAAPLLGLAGGEIMSIPCFAEGRQGDMRNQVDATNRRTVPGSGAPEATAYFGCCLDFNQTALRFPLNPPHNGSGGPFGGALLSIQQHVRNHHCCLASEIHFPLDPIPNGATPGSHDNLSQRNIVIVDSDNPGTPATHTVQSTFEVKPSTFPIIVPRAFGAAVEGPDQLSAVAIRRWIDSDELMIRWNNLPADSRVQHVDAHEIAAAAASRNGPPMLSALDADTLLARVGGVSFIPLHGPRPLNIPGLLSVELPPTVTKGQNFTLTVHQISGQPRRIIGSFQFTIPVRTATEILPTEERKLAVFRHIALAIPAGNRWRPIWDRLLGQIGDRVKELGGDPANIKPSPSGAPGDKPSPDDGKLPSLTGKIGRIYYDCQGYFDGFVLDTCEGDFPFKTCERGIEEVVLKARRDRLRVTVWFTRDRELKRIAINCC